MSRKTKKEKIIAEYRRKEKLLQPQATIPVTIHQSPAPNPITNHPSPITYPLSHYQSPLSGPKSHLNILSDLKRIAFTTALAICAQLVLWYYLGRG